MLTEVDLKEKIRNAPPAPCNAFGHVALVTYLTKNLQEMLQYNKELLEVVKAEMNEMKVSIEHSQQEIVQIVTPVLKSLWTTLEYKAEEQKQENVHLQDQIVELKKEKSILSQMIVQTDKKVKEAKETIGGY